MTRLLSNGEKAYSHKWQKQRAHFLAKNPLCVYCNDFGRVTEANVVDHKTPHRMDYELFWNQENWQSLCTEHHQSSKQQEEHRGYTAEAGKDGWPIDKDHPANTGRCK